MEIPFHLLFDTTALRALDPQGISARVLNEMASSGRVKIYIPWLVEKELASQFAELIVPLSKDHFRAAKWATEVDRPSLQDKLSQIDQALRRKDELMSKGVTEWIDKLGAERISPLATDIEEVFGLYFSGSPPFSGRKSREDLPDGFIFVAVRRLSKNLGTLLHVITADKRLGMSCEALKGVFVHKDLRGFFELRDLFPEVVATNIIKYIQDNNSELSERLESLLGEAILYKEVHAEFFPSDNKDARISGFGTPGDIVLNLDAIGAISDDAVMIPFTFFSTNNSVDLFIYKSEYYILREDRKRRFNLIDSDWNDHFVFA